MQSRSRSRARSRLPYKPDRLCRINAIQAVSASVGLYEKLELRIDLDADFGNPFDPEEIDLRATFTAPSGRKWKVWGFYNPSSWAALWMVRFSPTETGTWRYVVAVTTAAGRAKSAPAEFVVTPSAHRGFVGIAPNRRYPMHSDQTPFYGVGLWYNDKLVFGWVVNPGAGVANESFTVSGLRDGAYDVRLYKTWQGRYLDTLTIPARNGRLECVIPELRTTDGHAANMGDDVAFRIVPKGAVPEVP